MLRLLASAFRWIARNLLSLAVILAILFVGQWLIDKWREQKAASETLAQLVAARPHIARELLVATEALERQLRAKVQGADVASGLRGFVEAGIKSREMERRQIARDAPLAVKLPMTPEFRRALIVDAELTVLRRVLANASAVEAHLGDLAAGETEQASLVRRKHFADMKVYENRLERWQVRHDFPIAARTPLTSQSARLDTLAAELPALEKAAADAATRLDSMAFMVGMARRRLDAALVNLTGGHGAIESTLEAIDERIANERRATSEYVLSSVRRQLALALWILLGIIATPVLIKLFFYYLVAPWVARLPPIRLLPEGGTPGVAANAQDAPRPAVTMAGVSLPICLNASEELLLHGEYLQSSAVATSKNTCWLMNWSFPFTSLAAGLFALDRLRSDGDDPVVLSSTRDPLAELALLELPAYAAMVLHPTALAGVIQARDRPVRITSHWQLHRLHSYLTLQLRYLVFHGPAKLVLRGCRGVRLEAAGAGRLINQAATLGFSAHAEFSVTRCETFVSYWRGDQGLFNDRFSGDAAFYLYEETPNMRSKRGFIGRSLDGMTDAVLKVFGIA